MKLSTNNGRFLIYSEILGIALYYEFQEFFLNEEETPRERKKITRIIRNGKSEWEWALTWGQEPKELSNDENSLLNFASRKLRGVETLAIKNRKDSSRILRESNFFLASESGYLITCGIGSTSRRSHQGGNGWALFNFQKIQPTHKKIAGTPCDFGTYCGSCNNFDSITEEEMIPLTLAEWEILSGVPFQNNLEFGWFKSSLEQQPKLYGLHREGDYVLRTAFRPHRHIGELLVYPDQRQSHPEYSWASDVVISGYENPLSVEKVGIEVSGCKNFVVAEHNTLDGIRKIYFAEFQFFNLPSFWVGYETTTETEVDAVAGIKLKAANYMVSHLNYKLRRNTGVDSNKVLGYFKNKGAFVGTPADSYAVGNCALGTYEWMVKIFPNLPELSKVSWSNFPIYVYKEFTIPFEKMEKLFENSYHFRAVVENVFLTKNPIGGALTLETVSQLLFEPIEQSIGKIITKWEAKKLLGISLNDKDLNDSSLVQIQISELNSKNQVATLADLFEDQDIEFKF